ncbi:MAG: hypothetical protein LBM19_01525 [Holosporales bacterium]|jgi:hypothetical protein|nr:hypothetical protein [Holosporales bacterium]
MKISKALLFASAIVTVCIAFKANAAPGPIEDYRFQLAKLGYKTMESPSDPYAFPPRESEYVMNVYYAENALREDGEDPYPFGFIPNEKEPQTDLEKTLVSAVAELHKKISEGLADSADREGGLQEDIIVSSVQMQTVKCMSSYGQEEYSKFNKNEALLRRK